LVFSWKDCLAFISGRLDEEEMSDQSVFCGNFLLAEMAGDSLMSVGCENETN
jgi:hypothetical protein